MIDLMKPIDDGFFEAIPVSDRVNKVANMGPEILERVEEQAGPLPAPQKKKGADAPQSSDQLSLF